MRTTGRPKENKKPEYVVVYTSMGPLGAEVIKGKLESSGIPAMLQSEAIHVFPMTVDGMGQVKVLVPKDREQEARELIVKDEG